MFVFRWFVTIDQRTFIIGHQKSVHTNPGSSFNLSWYIVCSKMIDSIERVGGEYLYRSHQEILE